MKKSNAAITGLLTVGIFPVILGAGLMAYNIFFDEKAELPAEIVSQVSPYIDVEDLQRNIEDEVQRRREGPGRSIASDVESAPADTQQKIALTPPEELFSGMEDNVTTARPMSGDYMFSDPAPSLGLEPSRVAEELLIELEYKRLERKDKMEYMSFWITTFGGINTAAMGWFTMLYRRRERDNS
jgi:hypothetical protein